MQCRSVEKLKNLLLVTQSHAFQEDEKSRQEPEKENIQPAQHQRIQLNDSTKWENQSVVSLQPCALPKHQSTPVKRPMPHERPSKMVSPRLRKVGFKSKELNGNGFCNNENGEDDDDVNKLGRDTKSHTFRLGTAIDGVVDITNDGSDDDTDVDEDLDEEVVREALQPVSAATKTKNAVQESTKALELAFQHFTQLQSLFTQMSVQMKEKKDRKEIDDDTNGPEDEVEEDADSDLVPIVV